MTAQPLWENEEWAIHEDCLIGEFEDFIFDKPTECISVTYRDEIEERPIWSFRGLLVVYKPNPDLLYDAFLHLATLWDLQCNYDELRKIRDQAKQEETG